MKIVQLELWPLDKPEQEKLQIWKDVSPEIKVSVIAKLSELLAKTEMPEDREGKEEDAHEC